MDKLPKSHVITKEESNFMAKLDAKHVELHKLAVELLQTSYRLEWSYMFKKQAK
jgi:hypothetical protein